ncbi:hypothetical protein L1987_10712 [Smallanthus sonchifolius]|uniref:Uncharacterized protein n=1 Tax=Smallanthus sonchifolius TaxID=185202 RepID=A0ACB9JCD4_9ASTR|nr:hypothetical protein L1987_10712 [Smallanthus sonchifolius]
MMTVPPIQSVDVDVVLIARCVKDWESDAFKQEQAYSSVRSQVQQMRILHDPQDHDEVNFCYECIMEFVVV